jgi:hypothetical protein
VECNGDEPDEYEAPPRPRLFHASLAYSVMGTDLSFDGGKNAFMERRAATASLSYRYSDTITLQGGAGATIGGRFVYGDERFSFDPGWIASFAATWRVFGGGRGSAFLLAGGALAASGSVTRDAAGHAEDMYAIDLRLSVIAGKTFWDVLSPYAVLRAFGGPVLWRYHGEEKLAGDQYHFQIGAGVLVSLPEHFDVFAEGVPLGERAGVVGLGYSF